MEVYWPFTALHILVGHPNVVGLWLVLIYRRTTSTHYYLGSSGQVAYWKVTLNVPNSSDFGIFRL